MNVLILSAGRRVALLRAFQKDARQYRPGTKIVACDANPELSSACEVADFSFTVPHVRSPEFFDRLVERCSAFDVGVVVPTIDTELALLASRRDELASLGINAVVSDSNLVDRATDKVDSPQFFAERGFQVPRALDKSALTFPLFVKPKKGSSSIGVIAARSRNDLPPSYLEGAEYLFQELVPNSEFEEFTIDLYYDRSGRLKCLVPRLRIETRGGEVSKGQTVRDDLYDYLLPRLENWPGARGCLTLQVFANRARDKVLGIELNPRFGGGFPLSYASGARYPGWIIGEYLRDEPVDFYDQWQSGLLMLRYDDAVFRSVDADSV